MKVAKFGGSSLASGPQLAKVIEIIKADPTRRAIVVSAPGKRTATDTKVTDLLIAYSNAVINQQPYDKELSAIIARYQAISTYFHLSDQTFQPLIASLTALATTEFKNADYTLAAFKAAGEDHNAQLITLILKQLGFAATYMDPRKIGLLVTDIPADATILPVAYQKLAALRLEPGLLIFPGFFGVNEQAQICTFSRGGSDITGAIIAKALGADCYENFTDVDAVYAANPKLITKPVEIKQMTFREMRELAYAGFSVFHEEALIPAIEAGISVQVKNTNHPQQPGTKISAFKAYEATRPIAGIASSAGFCGLYVRKFLMNKEVGFTLKLLKILADYQISYDHIPSGIDDITIILREEQLTPEIEAAIETRIKNEIKPDDFHLTHHYALVMLVGEGLQDHIGMMAKASQAIASAGVSIVTLNQGASPVSITFGIRAKDEAKTVQALYNTFIRHFEEKNPTFEV